MLPEIMERGKAVLLLFAHIPLLSKAWDAFTLQGMLSATHSRGRWRGVRHISLRRNMRDLRLAFFPSCTMIDRMSTSHIDQRKVRRSFSRSAHSYDRHAVLQREVGDRLFDHLRCAKLQPARILDIGCGTGHFTRLLDRHYKKADIVALDLAEGMLYHCRRQRGLRLPWHGGRHYCAGDACQLPFANASFDLVTSNLALQWIAKPAQMLHEMRRVLAPGGLMLFSTFGRRTLHELRQSLVRQQRRFGALLVSFPDLMAMGDALCALAVDVPVVDSDLFTLTYPDPMALVRELKGLGASASAITARPSGLYGRRLLRELEEDYRKHYATEDGRVYASFEAIYAQAWHRPEGFTPKGDVLPIRAVQA